jgi:hypothetical protein
MISPPLHRKKGDAMPRITGLALTTTVATITAVGALAASATRADAGLSEDRDCHERAQLDRAFVIVLENHSQQGVVGDPNAPFLTSLARTYGNAVSYYGVTHPSEPNYVALISGSNWWINDDNPANRLDHDSVVTELERKHMSWGAYMEALPPDDVTADYWPSQTNPLYASKHNPFVLFDDIRNDPARLSRVRPYSQLAADLNAPNAPDFVFISPDQCNDMHGGVNTAVPGYPETPCPYASVNDDPNDAALKQKADAFVQRAVSTIMGSRAWTRHSAIFIVGDEGDYTGKSVNGGWDSPDGCCDSPILPAGAPQINAAWPGGVYGGGLVPAIVVAAGGRRHFESTTPYNHYSLLRTLEDAWGLRELAYTADHAAVPTMNEFLRHD